MASSFKVSERDEKVKTLFASVKMDPRRALDPHAPAAPTRLAARRNDDNIRVHDPDAVPDTMTRSGYVRPFPRRWSFVLVDDNIVSLTEFDAPFCVYFIVIKYIYSIVSGIPLPSNSFVEFSHKELRSRNYSSISRLSSARLT